MNLPARPDRNQELLALRLAQEIAINLNDIEDVLKHLSVSAVQWDRIQRNPHFQSILQEAVADWQSAKNTQERIKLKAAAMVEEWLVEAHRLSHDPAQPLSGKVELMKLIKSLTALGNFGAEGGGGEKFTVTINLGADQKLSFAKDIAPKTIEGKVEDAS